MDLGDEDARQRVAAAVKARRDMLGLRQADIGARGGPQSAGMYQLENGQKASYADDTIARLEAALEWEPGSVAAIVAGGSPVELPPRLEMDTTVEVRGWKLRISPREGASSDEIARVEEEVVAAAMRILRRAGFDDSSG